MVDSSDRQRTILCKILHTPMTLILTVNLLQQPSCRPPTWHSSLCCTNKNSTCCCAEETTSRQKSHDLVVAPSTSERASELRNVLCQSALSTNHLHWTPVEITTMSTTSDPSDHATVAHPSPRKRKYCPKESPDAHLCLENYQNCRSRSSSQKTAAIPAPPAPIHLSDASARPHKSKSPFRASKPPPPRRL